MAPGGRPAFRPPNEPRPRTAAYHIKKLRRKTRRRSLRRVSKNGRPLSSFFDRLPAEAIDRILQLSSNKPRSADWRGFVNPRVIVKWLKNGGVLADSISRTFHKLEVNETLRKDRDGIFLCGKSEHVVQHFCHIANSLGRSLTNIRVCHKTFPKLWQNAVANNCPNIKRLALMVPEQSRGIAPYPLSDVLRTYSGRLESLEISWSSIRSSDIEAIMMHCKGIKHLALNFETVRPDIEPLWRSLGPSLEELSLRSPLSYFGNNYQISALEKHCKKLRKLTLANIPHRYHPQITQVCVSLGAKLEFLTLEHCNLASVDLGKIASACQNVSVDICNIGGCLFEEILALGARALRVNIGHQTVNDFEIIGEEHFLTVKGESLKAVRLKCVNLIGFGVCGNLQVRPEAFQALFDPPKQWLRDFKCRSDTSLHASLVEVLASKVTSLVNFEFKGSKLPLFVLHKLLDANPMLRKVHIETCGYCWKWGYASNWAHVVEKLIQCPNLRDADLSCPRDPGPAAKCPYTEELRASLREACFPARKRDISIRICGYQYV